MRATGIIRRVDDLGRIVIPKELRRELFGKSDCTNMPMEFFVDEGNIVIKPYIQCNNAEN